MYPRGRSPIVCLGVLLALLFAAVQAEAASSEPEARRSRRASASKKQNSSVKLPRRPLTIDPKDVTLPPQVLLAPPSPSQPAEAERKPEPRRNPWRPRIDSEGLVLGDFHIVPRLVLSTDTRYDDVNTRERVLREELDALEAWKRGEVHVDPLTALLQNRSREGMQRGDPGYGLASTIHQVLQGALRVPNLLRQVPHPSLGAWNQPSAQSAKSAAD